MRVTFYDVLIATWEEAKDHLTGRQRAWVEAFLKLGNPTDAAVARALGISRAASSRMHWRVLARLRQFYDHHLKERQTDRLLEGLAIKHEPYYASLPEYLEKTHGKAHLMQYTAIKAFDERLGAVVFKGYSGREIENTKGLEHLQVFERKTFNPSPLSIWWAEQARKLSDEEAVSYSEAYTQLEQHYWHKWPEKYDLFDRLCRFCHQLLPLGQVFEGRKVTVRRRYCSQRCKTYHKRYG